jgi:hypothetical protein
MNLEEYRKRVDDAHTFTGIPSYWQELQNAYAEIERLQTWESIVRDIAQAVTDEGKVPELHRKIMRSHRSEWPFLWDRIDKAITACKENPTRNGRQHKTNFD